LFRSAVSRGIRLHASDRNGLDAIDRETVDRPVQVLALDAVKAILSRNTFCRHSRSLQPDPAPEVVMGFVADVGDHAALRHRRFRFIRNHSVESDAPQIAGSRRPRSFNGAGPALFSFQGFGPVLAPLIVGLAADLGFDRGKIPLSSGAEFTHVVGLHGYISK
jgi:hypothetical protein